MMIRNQRKPKIQKFFQKTFQKIEHTTFKENEENMATKIAKEFKETKETISTKSTKERD